MSCLLEKWLSRDTTNRGSRGETYIRPIFQKVPSNAPCCLYLALLVGERMLCSSSLSGLFSRSTMIRTERHARGDTVRIQAWTFQRPSSNMCLYVALFWSAFCSSSGFHAILLRTERRTAKLRPNQHADVLVLYAQKHFSLHNIKHLSTVARVVP